ncbi:MAG: DUF4124 domain-containing protein [Lysobacteraceae bacterium]|nr:MAG: DUF4124 domain-containing protein [Xanthomonadaceae bacterium]
MRACLRLPCLLLTFIAATPVALAADEVTIYRCTDVQGRLTLSDSPCAKGQRQETRHMIRPKDAPIRHAAPVTTPAPVAVPPPQAVVINTPRPLYECFTPDSTRYFSETPEGNPRWAPLWTVGAPVLAEVPVYEPGGLNIRVDDGRVSGRYQSPTYGKVIVPTAAGYGAGAWVRDVCHPLPQAEVCARLGDRRDELRRRFFNAQPSERAVLNREERSINARLASDCR